MTPPVKKERDVRLDFFRGLTMFIIFVAHGPDNPWNNWIPARFGFSSGAELFVFCSGFASSIAFGAIFLRRGIFLGTMRIAYRCWQVYWAHICVFLATIALVIIAHSLWPNGGFQDEPFGELFSDPMRGLLGMLTLSYLPAYLDILPMYLVILAMIPIIMILRRLHPALPFLFVAASYLSTWFLGVKLVGNPWTGFGWFFNPFAWQLIFFCGFFFGSGWIKPPPFGNRPLVIICLAFLVVSVPVNFWGFIDNVWFFADIHMWLLADEEKSNLHILRVIHFLALGYIALTFVNPRRHLLNQGIGKIIITVGRQSLAVFLVSIVTARAVSIAIKQGMGTPVEVAALNLAGFALIIATAYVVTWIKSQPWSSPKRQPLPQEASSGVKLGSPAE
ncbi:OpgC family protein [Candidatus Raskinella chloraquaticus]|uniref:OpgC protein n=1 Tax=Candidatus Raskinella chloraquaticus TaxID=1951219 RepID=A0A1W9I4X1_9HYPH|nr:MAG: hypothetical protein A4S15_04020 [Proteobacteria bacterium SG_bin8]